jgi:hypothetical protein
VDVGGRLSKGDNIDRGDAVNKVATRVASFFVPGLEE